MKIVIGNYPSPTDSRNLILNAEVSDATIGAKSNLFAIISKVEGLETAPYRNGTGDWSGADGGYISSQLYSARTITISGVYIDRQAGCDYSDQYSAQFDHIARLYIRSRLPIRTKQNIRIFMDSGMTFYTEGYCIDIKMDYTFIGHGEYQIAMYCPDPALYRGDQDGSLGSEWNTATLRKSNDVGFVGSKMIDPTSDPKVVEYAKMYKDTSLPSDNHGYTWNTGGRSTPVVYTGDFPYYPQFVIEPNPGEHVINPQFASLSQDKFFGLGYPESGVAKFRVTNVDSDGVITAISIDDPGAYDADFSSTILFQNYQGSNEGIGYEASVTMTKNGEIWEVTDFNTVEAGTGYHIGDILTPIIPGASILVINSGDKCIIDMSEHVVTLNGSSVSYYITPGSEWFHLDPLSTNNIIFASADIDDAEAVQVRWKNGYAGV